MRTSSRVEPQPESRSLQETLGLGAVGPVVSETHGAEFETVSLPPDHPKWARDTLTISHRARELIARIQPVVIRVFTFWDHRLRSIRVAGTHVGIDPNGGYRIV